MMTVPTADTSLANSTIIQGSLPQSLSGAVNLEKPNHSIINMSLDLVLLVLSIEIVESLIQSL